MLFFLLIKNQVDSDDDLPQLSAHALAALQEFYNEEKQKQEKVASEGNTDVEEDWVKSNLRIIGTFRLEYKFKIEYKYNKSCWQVLDNSESHQFIS